LSGNAADCEAWGDGPLGQPVDALTSFGYLAVGTVVVWWSARGRWSGWFAGFGVAVALEGVGSAMFHGVGGDLAQILHDVPLVALLGFIAGWHVARIAAAHDEVRLGRLATLGLALGAAAGVLGAVAGATSALAGVLVAITVVAELVARRRGTDPIWTAGPVALLGVATLAWWTGAPGGVLCDPTSVVQPHGLWHVLSALVALTWVDRAAIALDPSGAPRIWREATDRLVALVALGLSYAFYRSIDVVGRENIPWGRPMLIVANHANGFVDPVLVAAALGRLPRFLAKAALWRVVLARPFLALAGVLPVHRRGDGDDTGANASVFAACHDVHARGGMVAIFPEGTTGDRAALDRVRTGAARIALGSLPVAPDLAVLPVGLAFENRVEMRGRALVELGRPIQPGAGDVSALTEEIRRSLQAVSPDFASVDERERLRGAAWLELEREDAHRARHFGDVELVARRIAAGTDEARQAVAVAHERYRACLEEVGLRERHMRRGSTSLTRLAGAALVVAALGSVVATAALVHLPALLVTWGAATGVRSTATKGTVRVLVGLVTGLATWIVVGVVVADGWGSVVAGALVAAEGALALAVLPTVLWWLDDLWGRIRMRRRASVLAPVVAARDEVCDAVAIALESAR
jgi:glycerol-3-phosphate O-acyltransferase / dihydroxyacetone phosphate acyltransferase